MQADHILVLAVAQDVDLHRIILQVILPSNVHLFQSCKFSRLLLLGLQQTEIGVGDGAIQEYYSCGISELSEQVPGNHGSYLEKGQWFIHPIIPHDTKREQWDLLSCMLFPRQCEDYQDFTVEAVNFIWSFTQGAPRGTSSKSSEGGISIIWTGSLRFSQAQMKPWEFQANYLCLHYIIWPKWHEKVSRITLHSKCYDCEQIRLLQLEGAHKLQLPVKRLA